MKYFIAALFLSCGDFQLPAIGECETLCGLRLEGKLPAQGWDCNDLQRIEDGMLEEFPRVDDLRFREICPVLSTWVISFNSHDVFTADDEDVIGMTYCSSHKSVISSLPPAKSSLAHEMAHAVQYCKPNTCAHPDVDALHACWHENGIYDAIFKAGKFQ